MHRNKVVLITGCSSGFGRQLVTDFLSRGWSVVATLRRADERKGLFDAELKSYPEQLAVCSLDVTQSAQRSTAVELVLSRFGRLDCLINNAGYGQFGALEDLSENQLRDQFEANFFGPAFLIRAFLPLLRQSRGRVINVSSVVGYTGLPLSSAYCSSKFALEGFSESLYHELRPHGVQVALVEPGRFRTQFGENMKWADAPSSDSAYALQTRNYIRHRDKLAAGKAIPAETVVNAVVRLAEMKTMPLRTRCGSDAAAAHFLKKCLPERVAAGLASAIYDRIQMKKDA